MAGGTMTGAGTLGDPYLVEDATDLKAIETYGYSAYYRQANDFTLGTFEPVGYASGAGTGTAFTGEYAGNDKTISNGTISYGSDSYIGIFAYIDTGGTVKDLIVQNVDVDGNLYVGGIVGGLHNGSVSNINIDPTRSVSSNTVSGGICGYMKTSNTNTENCLNEASISIGASGEGVCGWK